MEEKEREDEEGLEQLRQGDMEQQILENTIVEEKEERTMEIYYYSKKGQCWN